jgi:hypothetical protein
MGFDSSNDRKKRAAINQSVFREVNERLEGLAKTFQYVARTAAFACECASLECVEQMEMSLDEYEGIRSDPNRFAVLPGHVYADVEHVVSENERFVVVEKIGAGDRIARETYPRS